MGQRFLCEGIDPGRGFTSTATRKLSAKIIGSLLPAIGCSHADPIMSIAHIDQQRVGALRILLGEVVTHDTDGAARPAFIGQQVYRSRS